MAGALETGAFSTAPYTSNCLLTIPYKNVGQKIQDIFDQLPDELVSPELKRQFADAMTELDTNWIEIERWVDHFYKNCICDCNDGGGSS